MIGRTRGSVLIMHALGLTFRLAKVHKTDLSSRSHMIFIGRCADGFEGRVSRDALFFFPRSSSSFRPCAHSQTQAVDFNVRQTPWVKGEKWSAPYSDMHALWTPPVHIPPPERPSFCRARKGGQSSCCAVEICKSVNLFIMTEVDFKAISR